MRKHQAFLVRPAKVEHFAQQDAVVARWYQIDQLAIKPGTGCVHGRAAAQLHARKSLSHFEFYVLKPGLQEVLAPVRYLHTPDAKLPDDILVLQTLPGQQHGLRPLRQADIGTPGASKQGELNFPLICKLDPWGNSPLFAPAQSEVERW